MLALRRGHRPVTNHEQRTPLLDLDSDLGRGLSPARAAEARAELAVRVSLIPRGPWDADRLAPAHPEHVGLLVLDGVLAREVLLADTVSTELLGTGDVLRPWRNSEDAPLLPLAVRWTALVDVRVAVLDRRFANRLARFPEVNATMLDRLTARAQRMAVSQAISQLNGVDRRLLALFWHLAERWGRMTPAGVAIPMTLSHRVLSQLVGARRPTVSTALSELAERRELFRRDDGSWLLTGEPIEMPDEEHARIIEHRRRLLPPERPVPAAVPVATARTEDMTMRLERRTSEAQLQRLKESRDAAGHLCRPAVDLRRERRAGVPVNGRHRY
jgi:CRP/FNR family transcriptional regulator, cyclic AMP receptor protein